MIFLTGLFEGLLRLLAAKPGMIPVAIGESVMNPIMSSVISLCVPYVVSDMASAGASFDWAGTKSKAHAAVAGAVHSAFADKVIDDAIDAVLDACAKVCQDKPDMQAALVALAKQDKGAAVKALEALVAKVLPPELGMLLTAA